MSDPNYLKCACQHCQGTIEFPAQGVGHAISCPHCGQTTGLFAPASHAPEPAPGPPEEPAPRDPGEEEAAADASWSSAAEPSDEAPPRSFPRLVLLGVGMLCLAAGGWAVLWKRHHLHPAASPATPATSSAASNPAALSPAPAPPPRGVAPKLLTDLQAGSVRLEKASGSSLVYAVGTLRNASAHQRFGIRIEIALADRNGNRAGTAKDYRAVLEPQQEWNFRALVLDSKAATAQVAAISEDE